MLILILVEQEQGLLVLNNAITACSKEIEHYKGKLLVKEEPRAVSVLKFDLVSSYPGTWLSSSLSINNFLNTSILLLCSFYIH